MKKIYLALSLLTLSCLLSVILAFLSYNKAAGGSQDKVEDLSKQVEDLSIRTSDLEKHYLSSSTVIVNDSVKKDANKNDTTAEKKTKTDDIADEKAKADEKTATVEQEIPKAEAAIPATTDKVVTGSSVNMRTDARAGSSVVTVLPTGTKVQSTGVTSKDSGITFVKITYNGKTGWVSQDFIK